nr:uncharacterized protein LOC129387772 [Dermacentor andersoni]
MRSQETSQNTVLHTVKQLVTQYNQTKANNLQRAKYRNLSRCIGGCPIIDQAKHPREYNEYRRLAHYFGELLQRAIFESSQQVVDETNKAPRIPEQYSTGRQSDNSHIPGEHAATLLRHQFLPSYESLLEKKLWFQKSTNRMQMQCTQQILKTMAPYMLHRLAQCTGREEVNAAALKAKITQHHEHQQPVQDEEGTSHWPPNVALEWEHIPTQDELLNINAAMKETGKATFEKKRQQRYKPNFLHTRPQQEAIVKIIANIIISYIRKRPNAEEIDARKMPAAQIEYQSKSKVGAQSEPEARSHRVAPTPYQTQHKFSALRESSEKSGDSLPTFDMPMLTRDTEEIRKLEAATKSEIADANVVPALKPFHQPFRESSHVVYNREPALNHQRVWQEGLLNWTPKHDVMRHYGTNAQNKAQLRSMNSTAANQSAQRFVKQTVQANSQYRHQQRTDIGRKKFSLFPVHAKSGGETLGGFLPSPHRQHKHKPNDSKAAKQQFGKNLFLNIPKEERHERVTMERQENSVELSEKKNMQENRITASQGAKGTRSGLAKEGREVTRNKQSKRLRFQKLTIGNPHNAHSKTIFRPQPRLVLRLSPNEGIFHNAPRAVEADFQDYSKVYLRPFAQRRTVPISIAGPSPANEKQFTWQVTQNVIFTHSPQKVGDHNYRPLAATDKQNKLAFIHPTAPFVHLTQRPTNVERQASKQKAIVQKNRTQQKQATFINESRHAVSQQKPMPFAGTTK